MLVSGSIRQKLILALLIVLIPLVVLQVITINRWYKARTGAILQGRVDAAYVAASAFDRYIMGVVHENDAAEAVLLIEGENANQANVRMLLDKLRESTRTIEVYAITDVTGKIVVSSPAGYEGISIADRTYFRYLREGRDWVVSDLLVSKGTGNPTFNIANAILGRNGEFRGVVFASADVNALGKVFFKRPEQGEVALLDSTGKLIMDSDQSILEWKARDWSRQTLVRSALSGQSAASDSFVSPLTGRRLIGGFVPVSATNWVVGSFLPEADVIAPIRQWQWISFAALGLTILASFLLTWLLGRYLTQPILILTEATTTFASGTPSPPVKIETQDELQILAESFNAMNERIQDRERRLADLARDLESALRSAEDRTAELEAVLNSIPVGVIIAEGPDLSVVQVNPAAQTIYGYERPTGMPLAQYMAGVKLMHSNGERFVLEELPITRAMSEGKVIPGEEIVIEGVDGEKRTLLVVASPITDEDHNVIGAVGTFQDISERKRMEERQRTIAEVLQDSLIPELPPVCLGMNIATKYIAALEEARVGGDFMDVFPLSKSKYAVVVGDVSGKGLSAAVDVAMTKYYLRSYAYEYPDDPGQVLNRVNTAMLHNDTPERFVTAFLAIFDIESGEMNYASAGHEIGILLHGPYGTVDDLLPTGMALGIAELGPYTYRSITFGPDDYLCLYTDGATEARSPDGAMLTYDGLKNIVSHVGPTGTTHVLDSVYASIRDYAAGHLRDDLALMIVGHK